MPYTPDTSKGPETASQRKRKRFVDRMEAAVGELTPLERALVETPSDMRRLTAVRLAAQGFNAIQIHERAPGLPLETVRSWTKEPWWIPSLLLAQKELALSPLEMFTPLLTDAIDVVRHGLEESDLNAARLVLGYVYGTPIQRQQVESSPAITVVFHKEDQVIEGSPPSTITS